MLTQEKERWRCYRRRKRGGDVNAGEREAEMLTPEKERRRCYRRRKRGGDVNAGERIRRKHGEYTEIIFYFQQCLTKLKGDSILKKLNGAS